MKKLRMMVCVCIGVFFLAAPAAMAAGESFEMSLVVGINGGYSSSDMPYAEPINSRMRVELDPTGGRFSLLEYPGFLDFGVYAPTFWTVSDNGAGGFHLEAMGVANDSGGVFLFYPAVNLEYTLIVDLQFDGVNDCPVVVTGTIVIGQQNGSGGYSAVLNATLSAVPPEVAAPCVFITGEPPPEVITVPFKVWHWMWGGSIVLRPWGVVLATIISEPGFNPGDINVETVAVGPDNAQPIWRPFRRDVNRDGVPDLAMFLWVGDLGLSPGDTQLCFSGELTNDTPVQGCDAVTVKLPPPPPRWPWPSCRK